MAREPPTYWDYLKLDRLLGLQGGLEDDEAQLMPDELLAGARVAPRADIEARIGQAHARAREFLLAEDVAAADRSRTRRIRAGVLFIESYRELPLLAWPRLLVDTLVEVDENLVLWRARHARMVERIIGRRVGTGGSSGVDYLDRTATYRVFTELWAVRTILLPKHALPELESRDAYGFA